MFTRSLGSADGLDVVLDVPSYFRLAANLK